MMTIGNDDDDDVSAPKALEAEKMVSEQKLTKKYTPIFSFYFFGFLIYL